ncbi:CA150 [Mytilus edulis]|uniref:TCERG1 n=1 Tax=Mytilus edulis TaxID=6550 RepID=A0A8S3RTW7_MYTED|nr:CA150 [Mytilus edulis]
MGVLHQAVWWNKQDVLKQLLNITSCDSMVRTKETMSEVGETGGCTPYEISQKYGYTDMGKLLEQHSNTLTTENELQNLPTFHYNIGDVQLSDLGLLRITLASYRQTFCPFTIDKHKPLAGVMEEIFKHVDSKENWSKVKEKLCDSLYTVCKPAFESLKAARTKEELYTTIVNVYTNENTKLHIFLNNALRRQEERVYRPTANDLGLGPYILMFHLLLMYWNKLIVETGITYRRMIVKDNDCRRYQKGAQFVWLSFITSAVDLENAEPFQTCVPKENSR